MKVPPATKREQGLTLIELFVVVMVISFLVIVFISQPDRNGKARAYRIQCVNNLKQIGLANRMWSDDHGRDGKYPIQVSETNGGTMEFVTGLNAFRHFQVMSNELSTPKLLFCFSESDPARIWATTFNLKPPPGDIPFTSNSNLSYFVGVDATETDPQSILSGDHNLTNGTPVKNGILELTPNNPAGWTAEIRHKVGNILLADGSVQQLSIAGLRTAVTNASNLTNLLRMQMPILSP